jgi:hypothetical protein
MVASRLSASRTEERALAVERLIRISNFWALRARSAIGKIWKIADIVRLWPGLSRRRRNQPMGLRQAETGKNPDPERWLRSGLQR